MTRLVPILLTVIGGCIDYDPSCFPDRRPVSKAEAHALTECDGQLCIDEIVASNHNLRIPPFKTGCPRDASQRLDPCDYDYLILQNRSDDRQYLGEYKLIRDDISFVRSQIRAALPVSEVLRRPNEIHEIGAIEEVPPGDGDDSRVLVFMEALKGEDLPDWMVPHDLGSEWGTVRLERDDCEVDRVYYPDLGSNVPTEDADGDGVFETLDDDLDGEPDEQDRAWRRVGNGCPDGLDECWRVACPSYQHPEIGCDVNPP